MILSLLYIRTNHLRYNWNEVGQFKSSKLILSKLCRKIRWTNKPDPAVSEQVKFEYN